MTTKQHFLTTHLQFRNKLEKLYLTLAQRAYQTKFSFTVLKSFDQQSVNVVKNMYPFLENLEIYQRPY